MIVSQSRTSLDRNLWQLSRAIFTACLPSLIHCSAVPRLLWNRTTARFGSVRFVTMNPTRGNNSPEWCSTFATTLRAVFQPAALRVVFFPVRPQTNLLVLNAFRHHRPLGYAIHDGGRRLDECSTPFGITDH